MFVHITNILTVTQTDIYDFLNYDLSICPPPPIRTQDPIILEGRRECGYKHVSSDTYSLPHPNMMVPCVRTVSLADISDVLISMTFQCVPPIRTIILTDIHNLLINDLQSALIRTNILTDICVLLIYDLSMCPPNKDNQIEWQTCITF